MSFDWRVGSLAAYARGMKRRQDARRKKAAARRVEPVRRMKELDQWVGLWVAVKDNEVIAAAGTSVELVPMVKKLGPKGAGAVARFVPNPSDEIMIGVG